MLLVAMMLALLPFLAQAEGEVRPVEYPTLYRTAQIEGLSIFYRLKFNKERRVALRNLEGGTL